MNWQSISTAPKDDLIQIGETDCLFDVDESAYRRLLEKRGGCYCCVSPPCSACSDPIEEAELNAVGYTYLPPPPKD